MSSVTFHHWFETYWLVYQWVHIHPFIRLHPQLTAYSKHNTHFSFSISWQHTHPTDFSSNTSRIHTTTGSQILTLNQRHHNETAPFSDDSYRNDSACFNHSHVSMEKPSQPLGTGFLFKDTTAAERWGHSVLQRYLYMNMSILCNFILLLQYNSERNILLFTPLVFFSDYSFSSPSCPVKTTNLQMCWCWTFVLNRRLRVFCVLRKFSSFFC